MSPPGPATTPTVAPTPSGVGAPTGSVGGEIASKLNVAGELKAYIFAKDLKNPRVLVSDPNGVLIASLTSEGKVVALPDKNKDGVADGVFTVAEGLNKPHGLAFYCPSGGPAAAGNKPCKLFIAETNMVRSYLYDAANFRIFGAEKIIDLPSDGGPASPSLGGHFTRSLLIADGKLFISVGSSCNVCIEKNDLRAKILVSDLDGNNVKVFAAGLRNSVFMATNPSDGKIWATEMGRDLLGDNIPPDEINIIGSLAGRPPIDPPNFGWPRCYGQNIHDDAFDKNTYIRNPCMEPFEIPSFIDIPAHSAPLGLAFYKNDLLVAFHGSWNRSVPTGYKVVKYDLASKTSEDFITGWLEPGGKSAWGRPAGILVDSQNNIYISDDKAGYIYLIR